MAGELVESDLRDLFVTLWLKKHFILLSCICTFSISIFYAYAVAKPVYESSALLLPTQAPTADQLGTAAMLLGKKSGSSADVDLYQSLLTSRTVLHKLLMAPIKNLSDTGKGRIDPLFKILGVDSSMPGAISGAIKSISKSIAVNSKESGAGGILEVKFFASAPWLAQQIGNALLEIGQEELRQVRIERSKVILSRMSIAVDQSHSEWDASSKTLTDYKVRNRSISSPEQMLELARLEMEKSAKEQKYLLVRKEYEIQLIENTKAAPPMMILDPADLPTQRSKPKRPLIMALGLIVGFTGGCVGVLGWKILVVPPTQPV